MDRYLITQSLLASYTNVFDCYEGQQEEAYASFLRTLNREPTEPTQAMLDGRSFEAEVYAAAWHKPRQPHRTWENGIQAVAKQIEYAPFQVKAKKEIIVGGECYLVYGIMDAVKAGTIYDVKFKARSLASQDIAGCYRRSPQHSAYFYICPEANQFVYLVSDGEDLYRECYCREDTPDIRQWIEEFISGISRMDLLEKYHEKWRAL